MKGGRLQAPPCNCEGRRIGQFERDSETDERCENTKVSSPKDTERHATVAESGRARRDERMGRRENFNLHVVMVIQLAMEINLNKIHNLTYHKITKNMTPRVTFSIFSLISVSNAFRWSIHGFAPQSEHAYNSMIARVSAPFKKTL